MASHWRASKVRCWNSKDSQRRCRERDIEDVQSAMTTGFEKGCRCCDGTESKSASIVAV